MKQEILLNKTITISFEEVCEHKWVSRTLLIELLEHGLLGEPMTPLEELQFDLEMIQRLQSALRLQQDLGVNSSGAVVILELRDKLDALQEELDILRRHLQE